MLNNKSILTKRAASVPKKNGYAILCSVFCVILNLKRSILITNHNLAIDCGCTAI